MSVVEYFDTEQAGGFNAYPARVTKKIKYRKDVRTRTKPDTIASGQVLKAYTFVKRQTVAPFHLVACTADEEIANVVFTAITSGQTMILGGLTWTAGGSGTTAAQLVTAWRDIADGATAASLAARTGGGSFTAGTFSGWTTTYLNETTVQFLSSTGNTNVTDLAATGTGAASATITTIAGSTTDVKPVGVTLYDVDATSGAVDAEIYAQESFWADEDGTCALLWRVDVTTDTVTKADGTTVACTAYDTGCSGTTDLHKQLKKRFVEGTGFEYIGFVGASI